MHLDAAYARCDSIEAELSKEVESSRLFRLSTKISTVVDRAELNGDFGWAEYGDRYMLKLFRDYVFHQVRLMCLNYIFMTNSSRDTLPFLLREGVKVGPSSRHSATRKLIPSGQGKGTNSICNGVNGRQSEVSPEDTMLSQVLASLNIATR